jgi:hypothetical protein
VIKRFQNPFVRLSLDEGKIHRTSVLDFLLLRGDPAHRDMDFMGYDSAEVPRSNRKFYMSRTSSVIARLADEQMRTCDSWRRILFANAGAESLRR